jgi:hypothetical protein
VSLAQPFGVDMTRLILTTSDSGAGSLKRAGLADIVIPLGFRFAWGRLPSDAELAASLAPSSTQHPWLWNLYRRHLGENGKSDHGLIDFCARCDTIELWIDPEPNAQLMLIWLLNYLRGHRTIASKLALVQADVAIGDHPPEELTKWRLPVVKILGHHLETACAAWQAYRQPTPQDWFNLRGQDLSVLPRLQQTVLELLNELPADKSGLGTTEMRMLELISAGNAGPFDVFPGENKPNQQRVFSYWEVGSLLDGLAHCLAPAVSGLGEGPFTTEMHDDRDRHARYQQSRLSLTELGRAVLAGRDDFSQHNPIHRWWGGTELTNDHLWRWDPSNRTLIVPW